MKLSIIIPYWNDEKYIGELLDSLSGQINDQVEVILVDDGSKKAFKTKLEWVKVYRKKNGGCASARNKGIEVSTGEYLAFLDSDDVVAKNYVAAILEKIKEGPDVIEMSWKSLEGSKFDYKLNSSADRLTNNSMWCRVVKRDFIGDQRFNEAKDSTEDEDFSRHLGIRDKIISYKRAVITDYLYFYRDVDNSKIKRFIQGLMNTKRVTYYYRHVSAKNTDILEQIKEDDKYNEVVLLTEQCDIPELARYCQIKKPSHIWTHYLKGDPYHNIDIITPPLKTEIVIYRRGMYVIGGLMSFTMNFVDYMADKHDITVVTEKMDERRLNYLSKKCRVLVNKQDVQVVCDTMIVLSILDELPTNVHAKKILRMCHTCRTNPKWSIPEDYDQLAFVSETSKKSFDYENGEILHNLAVDRSRDMLLLVSATRLPAADKGDIGSRMIKLANMLNEADIPFIWLNFADGKLNNPPKNFFNMGMTMDIQTYIKKADYVVALSDSEAWSYTVLESLTHNTPLICTPFPSVFEMGAKDGVNAHVVPFDMNFDVHKLLDIPKFEYEYDNKVIIDQWEKLLSLPAVKTKMYKKAPKELKVRVLRKFCDKYTGQHIPVGVMTLPAARVDEIQKVEQEKKVQLIQIIG